MLMSLSVMRQHARLGVAVAAMMVLLPANALPAHAAGPSLSVSDAQSFEGSTYCGVVRCGIFPLPASAVFSVRLSAPSRRTVTVQFVTADGSAVAPGDYQATSGVVTFLPGETGPKNVGVGMVLDDIPEPDKTFFLNLSNPTGNAVLGDGQGVGTVHNGTRCISLGCSVPSRAAHWTKPLG